jgi:hypothetical protein
MVTVAIEIFTSPFFPLVTLLLGFLVGHRLSIGRDKRKEFNDAATIFRNAFIPETTFLRHNANVGELGSSNDLGELLSFAYVRRHLKALEIFKNYLSPEDNRSIDKAWKEYCYHPKNIDSLYFEQYSCKNETIQEVEKMKKIALKRLEKILEFGKQK